MLPPLRVFEGRIVSTIGESVILNMLAGAIRDNEDVSRALIADTLQAIAKSIADKNATPKIHRSARDANIPTR